MAELTTKSGIRLHYQEHGNPDHPALILIMGLGAQMTVWPESLISELVQRGNRVIQFDNRDVGLSSKLDQYAVPNPLTQALKQKLKLKQSLPYSLDDMANDVIALMDELQLDRAHLVGASMGGMIAQIVAARFKARCASLTTLMSSSGNPKLPKAKLKVLWQLLNNRRANPSDETAIEQAVALNRILAGSRFDVGEQELRSLAERNIKRSYHPPGFKRQLAAVASAQNRIPLLSRIKIPTLIIHGSEDPLIPVAAALDLAIHIPKSKIRIIRGMGHNLPASLSRRLGKMIAKHVRKAQRKLTPNKLTPNKLAPNKQKPITQETQLLSSENSYASNNTETTTRYTTH